MGTKIQELPPELQVGLREFKSSTILKAGFFGPAGEDLLPIKEAKEGTLRVQFSNGSLFAYHKATAKTVEAFFAAPSAGKFFNAFIKDNPLIKGEKLWPKKAEGSKEAPDAHL